MNPPGTSPTPKPRHTQQIAQDDLFGTDTKVGLFNEVFTLCEGDPTTEELEEASAKVLEIHSRIRVWISARRLIGAAKRHNTLELSA